MSTAIVHVPDRRRYEVRVDGRTAGYVSYVRRGGRLVILHTELDPAYEGQGLGSGLARAALDDARDAGTPVLPLCPFVEGWIAKHPDYEDLVDRELLERLQAGS